MQFKPNKQRSIMPDTVALQLVPPFGCQEYPCRKGYACQLANGSLSCHRCAKQLASKMGLSCTGCPSGTQATANGSGCETCPAKTAGIDGLCLPCRAGTIPFASGLGCRARKCQGRTLTAALPLVRMCQTNQVHPLRHLGRATARSVLHALRSDERTCCATLGCPDQMQVWANVQSAPRCLVSCVTNTWVCGGVGT